MRRNLDTLFAPRSVAVFGASARAGRPGHDIIAAMGVFGGGPKIYPVTPRYDLVAGIPCISDAHALPEPVDLAVIASGADRILSDAFAALEAGAGALHVLGDLGADDCDLLARAANDHNAILLGPNSVGFVNYARRTLSTWVTPPEEMQEAGNIALILQSGALFSYANAIDPRLKFSLTIQPGREAGVTLADALGYALEMPETRVVGLYFESIASGAGFVEALSTARRRDIPVVLLAPGKSRKAAEAIATHARRLAGSSGGLEAVCRRYGVIVVTTLDQFWCTLRIMSADLPAPGAGGVAVVTDSGAQRAMTIDAAAKADVRLANFSTETQRLLREGLASDLQTENPLDIWSGEKDLADHTARCLKAAIDDPDTAIGLVLTEFGAPDNDTFPTRMADGALEVAKSSGKPVFAACFSTRHFSSSRIRRMEAAGLPVLDGLDVSLIALKHLCAWRDRPAWQETALLDDATRQSVEQALDQLQGISERAALEVLSLADVPVTVSRIVHTAGEAEQAAEEFGGPVVLKSAAQLLHKTEAGGVKLDLRGREEVRVAYEDLATRLGPAVLVAPMVKGGIELALGAVTDPVFGPIVMVGAGGTAMEILDDRQFALAPVSEDEALVMIDALRVSPLLAPHRGKPGTDRKSIAQAIAGISRLIATFPDRIAEIDVNPVIARPGGAVAVDAAILLKEPDDEEFRR